MTSDEEKLTLLLKRALAVTEQQMKMIVYQQHVFLAYVEKHEPERAVQMRKLVEEWKAQFSGTSDDPL